MLKKMLCLLLISQCAMAQPRTDKHLEDILMASDFPQLKQVLAQPEQYRLQIVYTTIDRDDNNKPGFRHYFYHFDPKLYYNPASVVKMPLAFLSLEKLNRMNHPGINKCTTMLFDSSYERQNARYHDSTAENGFPSIAQFIRKAFLISDNDAYNRMYQFVGQKTIHRSLRAKGYQHTLMPRQFRGYSPEQNRHSNGIRFVDSKGTLIYHQLPAYNSDSLIFPDKILLGKGRWTNQDSLINEPMDFSTHNNVSIFDFHRMLQSVIFPESFPPSQRFDLTEKDLQFLRKFLSQYPSETSYPFYDRDKFYDSYVKFFFRDSTHKMPEGVRVFNKVGWSYGFLTDISYVADFKNKIEYMLSATVYVNSDEIINDGKYDYDDIGYPFLHQLGQVIYRHELQRERKNVPDLSALKMDYDHRDPNDRRKGILVVEN